MCPDRLKASNQPSTQVFVPPTSEPTSGLDSCSALAVVEHLRDRARDSGLTVRPLSCAASEMLPHAGHILACIVLNSLDVSAAANCTPPRLENSPDLPTLPLCCLLPLPRRSSPRSTSRAPRCGPPSTRAPCCRRAWACTRAAATPLSRGSRAAWGTAPGTLRCTARPRTG
jgi:hypothetical protein